MFTYLLILLILLPLTYLSSAIEGIFSPEELSDMGIRLENASAPECP